MAPRRWVGSARSRCIALKRITHLADVAGAMSLEGSQGNAGRLDERIHAARPHPGQMEVAAHLRELLAGSEIRASHSGQRPARPGRYTVCVACRRFTGQCATRAAARA